MTHRLFPALASLVAAGFLTACPNSEDDAPKAPSVTELRLAEARAFGLADPSCAGTAGTIPVSDQSIYSWNGSEAALRPFRFAAGSTATTGLASQPSATATEAIIDATTWGLVVRSDGMVRRSSNEESASETNKLIENRKLLQICNTHNPYPKDSIEAAALTSLAAIQEAHAFYTSLDTQMPLPKAILDIFPRFEHSVEVHREGEEPVRRTMVEVDNAAWSMNWNEEKKTRSFRFTLYPPSVKSDRSARDFGHAELWQSDFVMKHEFGHHVFFVRTPRIYAAPSNAIMASARRDQAAIGEFDQASFSLSSLNEAFADLFAYYTNNASAGSIAGIPSFQNTRDPNAPTFATGQTKSLSAFAIDVMAGRRVEEKKKDLPENQLRPPSFTDVHTIGTIVAHGFHRFLSASGKADGTPLSPSESTKILLKWLDASDARYQEGELGNIALLRSLVAQFVTATLQATQQQALNSQQCATLRDVFPVFATTWATQKAELPTFSEGCKD